MRHTRTTLSALYKKTAKTPAEAPIPELLTTDEYIDLRNREKIHHEDSAYRTTSLRAKDRAEHIQALQEHGLVLKQTRRHGLPFAFRALTHNTLFPNAPLGPHNFMISVFDMSTGEKVGAAQDEWGCLLITVDPDYRGFHLA